jgi:hypothetical protein
MQRLCCGRGREQRSIGLGRRRHGLQLLCDHFGQAVRRLAGLGRERDLDRRHAEAREPAHDRGGNERLAGAGAAGDHGERARQRELDGTHLFGG